ncbi:hypothetical protein [Magnetospirillum sp. 15-1]|uniref:hypothetical protein n=1 Tax=Magnetospirillum sp. 15-1 TaxID=1979370 RepID=UPI0011450441|nr:hypothetical protein [Magnetospirillum sp. 15-1]
MSLTTLATLLDDLAVGNRAVLNEAKPTVGVSELAVGDARAVLAECADLNWNALIVDRENTPWDVNTISEHFAPFRITIHKPDYGLDTIALLTRSGFTQWLTEPRDEPRCLLARLPQPFATQRVIFTPWGDVTQFEPLPPTKSPRSLVREYGELRVVPNDIRPWLLQADELPIFDDPTFRLWAGIATVALLRSLPDEVEMESYALKFKGPPRLVLMGPVHPTDALAALGRDGFLSLQRAQRWIFENEREAEMRHVLLATELAQTGGTHLQAEECARIHIAAALDGAKIAYQMSLSDLSRDTLKALGDLRKAVTEETAKVTDATRQTIAAVASALAIGIGLIATRVATNVYPAVMIAVMAVALAYVFIVALSGTQFILLQRSLRIDWQPRLYRFLIPEDYKRMVTKPIGRAEYAFWWTAGIGLASVVVLLVVILCIPRSEDTKPPPVANNQAGNIQPQISAPKQTTPTEPVPASNANKEPSQIHP